MSHPCHENATMPRPSMLIMLMLAVLSSAASGETIALRNVNVLTMESETVLPAHTVLVVDGRIATLAPMADLEIPKTATVIEGEGRWLMPGLAEAHGHLPPASSPNLQRILDLFVSQGVTTVRGLLGDPSQLALREELANGTRFGPRIQLAGPSLNGNSVQSVEQAAELVADINARGYDWIKIHPGLDVARFDAIMQAARTHGLRVAGHVPEAVGLLHALEQGMGSVEHMDDYVRTLVPDGHPARTAQAGFFGMLQAEVADPRRIPLLVERTRAAQAAISPTETLMQALLGEDDIETLMARAETAYVDADTRNQWRQARQGLRSSPGFSSGRATQFLALRRQLLKALHDGGVPIVLGSDAPQVFNVPGFSSHRELALMVAAGLTPYQALRSGTVVTAEHLGLGAQRGRIAPGYEADLILLDANPLDDIANTLRVHGVMLQGRWHDRAALDARLTAIREAMGSSG